MEIKLDNSVNLQEEKKGKKFENVKESVNNGVETIKEKTGQAVDAVKNIQYTETYQRGIKGVQSLVGMAKMGLNILSDKLEKYQDNLKNKN
jgi:hypothetical protein